MKYIGDLEQAFLGLKCKKYYFIYVYDIVIYVILDHVGNTHSIYWL